jgi:hypothetical protein
MEQRGLLVSVNDFESVRALFLSSKCDLPHTTNAASGSLFFEFLLFELDLVDEFRSMSYPACHISGNGNYAILGKATQRHIGGRKRHPQAR